MLDSKTEELVRNLMRAERAARRPSVQSSLSKINIEFSRRGTLQSSARLHAVRRTLAEELSARGTLLLGMIQRTHHILGASLTDTLLDDLKREAHIHIDEDSRELTDILQRVLANLGPLKMSQFTMEQEALRVTWKVDAELDLYVSGLRAQAAKTMTSGQSVINMNISGPVGAVQTGAGSTAHIAQNLGTEDRIALEAALAVLQDQLNNSTAINAGVQDEVQTLVDQSKTELKKEKPALAVLRAMLSSAATTIQTVADMQPAYRALKTTLVPLGVLLP